MHLESCVCKFANGKQTASAKETMPQLYESALEAVAMLGHASHELAAICLEQIRPGLKQEFAALCSGKYLSAVRYLGRTYQTSSEMLGRQVK